MAKKKFKLLAVGDSPKRRELAELIRDQFTIVEADTGAQAAELLCQENHIDAIVVVLAPGQALQDFQQLHDDPEYHRIPVLFVVQQASSQKMEESFSFGAFDVMPLPMGDPFVQARFAHLRYALESKKNSELLQKLVRRAMKQEDPEQSFHCFLRYVGLMTGAERAFIFEGHSRAPYAWFRKDNLTTRLRSVAPQDFKAMEKTMEALFAQYGSLAIEDTSQVAQGRRETQQLFRKLGIRNLVAFPVEFRNRRLCVISLENVPENRIREMRRLLEQAITPLIMLFANRNTVFHLRANSAVDQMTGTLNRNAFDRVSTSLEPEKSLGVMFADVDNLKRVNDEQGHDWGDRLICDAAEALLRFRHGGNVFRIGGDEFVILWQGLTEKNFQDIGRRLERQLAERKLQLSLGFTWAPDLAQGFEAILRQADQKMYANKQQRKAQAESPDTLVKPFEQALQKGEFTFGIQPVVNPQNRKVIGGEALARWVRGGVVLEPVQFLEDMAKTSFIFQLDQYIWEQVCRYQRQLLNQGIRPLALSVNIHARDFSQGDVPGTIQKLLQKYGLTRREIFFEIREAEYRSDPLVRSGADALYDAGLVVFLDEFGLEYDSLQTLGSLKIRGVKFSYHLRLDIGEDYKQQIISSMLNLAERYRLLAVVTGIETSEQDEFLVKKGCNCAQGFYWYHPMSPQSFQALLGKADMVQNMERLLMEHNVGSLTVYSLLNENILSETKLNNLIGPMAIVSVKNDDSVVRVRQVNQAYYNLLGQDAMSPENSQLPDIPLDRRGETLVSAFRKADKRLSKGHVISFYYRVPRTQERKHLAAKIIPIVKNQEYRYYLVLLHKYRR